MDKSLKKNLEVIFYITVEVGLAYIIASWADMNEELRALVTIAIVYIGKEIIKKVKE
jgi:hypothetical protein